MSSVATQTKIKQNLLMIKVNCSFNIVIQLTGKHQTDQNTDKEFCIKKTDSGSSSHIFVPVNSDLIIHADILTESHLFLPLDFKSKIRKKIVDQYKQNNPEYRENGTTKEIFYIKISNLKCSIQENSFYDDDDYTIYTDSTSS
jgi:hypothetical protein